MSYMEMVLALFAVVFFASVAANYNRQVIEQTDYLINASQYVQANQLCHAVLDEIDAKLFARMIAFFSVKTTYANVNRTVDLQFPGDVYQINIQTVDCDSLGIPLSTPATNNIWVRVTVTASTPGLKVPATLQRVYTKTHLNL